MTTLEACLVTVACLVITLAFLLQGPRMVGQMSQHSQRAQVAAAEWTQEGYLYERVGSTNLKTQPERLAFLLDYAADLLGQIGMQP